jgi:hypothetical protein
MVRPLTPYRDIREVRWVCIACHLSLSTLAGLCPRCHVERLELDREDVRTDLRAYADRKLRERILRFEVFLGVVMALSGGAAFVPLMPTDDKAGFGDWALAVLVAYGAVLILATIILAIYARRPSSPFARYRALQAGDLPGALHALGATLDS